MEKEFKALTFKEVFSETKKAHYGFSTHLLFFAIFTILSLMLAYVAPFSLIVTVPFVIIPSYFAFSSLNAIKGKRNSEGVGFFKLFRTYFSMIFFGGYRLLFGLLKAFIAYVATNMAVIFVLDLAVLSKSSEFEEFMAAIEKSTDSASLNEAFNNFTNSVMNSPEIQKWIYLSAAVSLVVGAIVFIHHIHKHSVKIKRNLFIKTVIPARQFNFVERKVRKTHRKFIWGSYIRTSWFIKIAIVLAGAGGIVGSYFLLKDFNPNQAFVISLFLMFVVCLPLFNYMSKLQEMMYFTLLPVYETTFTTIALVMLTKYKDKIGMEEEEFKKIQDILNETKSKAEEEKPEEKKDLEDK